MKPAEAPAHDSTTLNISAGIKDLAARLQSLHGKDTIGYNNNDALDRAWTIILDLDTSRQVQINCLCSSS
jgi:hypothetical protein